MHHLMFKHSKFLAFISTVSGNEVQFPQFARIEHVKSLVIYDMICVV